MAKRSVRKNRGKNDQPVRPQLNTQETVGEKNSVLSKIVAGAVSFSTIAVFIWSIITYIFPPKSNVTEVSNNTGNVAIGDVAIGNVGDGSVVIGNVGDNSVITIGSTPSPTEQSYIFNILKCSTRWCLSPPWATKHKL